MLIEVLAIGGGLLVSDVMNGFALFEFATIKPDFVLIFAVFFALRRGAFAGIWIGFAGGLLTDADLGIITATNNATVTMIGLHSFAFTAVAFIVGQFVRSYYRDSVISAILVIFASCLTARVLVYIMYYFFFGSIETYSILAVSFYTAILGGTIWWVVLSFVYKYEMGSEML